MPGGACARRSEEQSRPPEGAARRKMCAEREKATTQTEKSALHRSDGARYFRDTRFLCTDSAQTPKPRFIPSSEKRAGSKGITFRADISDPRLAAQSVGDFGQTRITTFSSPSLSSSSWPPRSLPSPSPRRRVATSECEPFANHPRHVCTSDTSKAPPASSGRRTIAKRIRSTCPRARKGKTQTIAVAPCTSNTPSRETDHRHHRFDSHRRRRTRWRVFSSRSSSPPTKRRDPTRAPWRPSRPRDRLGSTRRHQTDSTDLTDPTRQTSAVPMTPRFSPLCSRSCGSGCARTDPLSDTRRSTPSPGTATRRTPGPAVLGSALSLATSTDPPPSDTLASPRAHGQSCSPRRGRNTPSRSTCTSHLSGADAEIAAVSPGC